MRVRLDLVAELFSLVSGAVLAWPALRLNHYLRHAHDQELKADNTSSLHLHKLRKLLADAYTSPKWSAVDHTLTVIGVVLLIASSAIRLRSEFSRPEAASATPGAIERPFEPTTGGMSRRWNLYVLAGQGPDEPESGYAPGADRLEQSRHPVDMRSGVGAR